MKKKPRLQVADIPESKAKVLLINQNREKYRYKEPALGKEHRPKRKP